MLKTIDWLEHIDDLSEFDERINLDSKLPLDSFDRTQVRIIHPFLTIEGDDDTDESTARTSDHLDRFSNRSTGRDDIIDDQNSFTIQGTADDRTTFTMRFGFLSMVTESHRMVLSRIEPSQFGRSDGSDRDAFVRRSEDDVKFEFFSELGDPGGIRWTEKIQKETGVEEARVEEVGWRSAGF